MKKGRKKGHRTYSIFIRKLLLENCYTVDSNGKFGTFILFTIDILHKTDNAQNCTHFLILIYLKIGMYIIEFKGCPSIDGNRNKATKYEKMLMERSL